MTRISELDRQRYHLWKEFNPDCPHGYAYKILSALTVNPVEAGEIFAASFTLPGNGLNLLQLNKACDDELLSHIDEYNDSCKARNTLFWAQASSWIQEGGRLRNQKQAAKLTKELEQVKKTKATKHFDVSNHGTVVGSVFDNRKTFSRQQQQQQQQQQVLLLPVPPGFFNPQQGFLLAPPPPPPPPGGADQYEGFYNQVPYHVPYQVPYQVPHGHQTYQRHAYQQAPYQQQQSFHQAPHQQSPAVFKHPPEAQNARDEEEDLARGGSLTGTRQDSPKIRDDTANDNNDSTLSRPNNHSNRKKRNRRKRGRGGGREKNPIFADSSESPETERRPSRNRRNRKKRGGGRKKNPIFADSSESPETERRPSRKGKGKGKPSAFKQAKQSSRNAPKFADYEKEFPALPSTNGNKKGTESGWVSPRGRTGALEGALEGTLESSNKTTVPTVPTQNTTMTTAPTQNTAMTRAPQRVERRDNQVEHRDNQVERRDNQEKKNERKFAAAANTRKSATTSGLKSIMKTKGQNFAQPKNPFLEKHDAVSQPQKKSGVVGGLLNKKGIAISPTLKICRQQRKPNSSGNNVEFKSTVIVVSFCRSSTLVEKEDSIMRHTPERMGKYKYPKAIRDTIEDTLSLSDEDSMADKCANLNDAIKLYAELRNERSRLLGNVGDNSTKHETHELVSDCVKQVDALILELDKEQCILTGCISPSTLNEINFIRLWNAVFHFFALYSYNRRTERQHLMKLQFKKNLPHLYEEFQKCEEESVCNQQVHRPQIKDLWENGAKNIRSSLATELAMVKARSQSTLKEAQSRADKLAKELACGDASNATEARPIEGNLEKEVPSTETSTKSKVSKHQLPNLSRSSRVAGWTVQYSKKRNRPYFFNVKTNETKWENPDI